MNLLKSPEQDFTDIEQRLRSTYAHVTNEFVPEHQEPLVVFVRAIDGGKSKRRRFGVWAPRLATLGAVAGMAFAGFNLANRGSTTTLVTARPSGFKSFPHLIPTAPASYHLDSVFRELTRSPRLFQTTYRAGARRSAVADRSSVTLTVRADSMAQTLGYEELKVGDKMVWVPSTMRATGESGLLAAEILDKRCGVIGIYGIKRDLAEIVKNLRCRKVGSDLRAELANRKRAEISFSGLIEQPYAQLRFYFVSDTEKSVGFNIVTQPCDCDHFEVSLQNPSGLNPELRLVDGQRVYISPDAKGMIWAPTSRALFTLNSNSLSWNPAQFESVVQGVKEVDQATFTALLESNGIREVSLLP
jgi:hypothetical protein